MKKSAVFAIGTFLLAGSIGAAEYTPLLRDSMEKETIWFKNPVCIKMNGGGSHEYVENGRNGKCLKVVTNDKQIFMYNTRRPVPVKSGNRVRVTFWAKGKGIVSLSPMGKTTAGKVIYLPDMLEKINADEWEKIIFFIVMKAPKDAVFKELSLRMNIQKNSNFLIDDFCIESEAAAK